MEKNVQQFPPFREPLAPAHHDEHDHDAHGHDDHHAHHEPSFLTKYVFSTDHKIIGIQYGMVALSFMLFGFCLMLLMRWQIAHPAKAVPLLGPLLEKMLGPMASGGVISPEL